MFQRRRVEQDLLRIRQANLPHAREEDIENAVSSKKEPARDRIGAKDILAMVIAVFSIILPYVLFFIGVLGAVVFALSRLLR